MSKGKTGDAREQWIAILEAAYLRSPEGGDEEWSWLLEQLGLPRDYFMGLLEAIRQGRWRLAKNPKSYLKTVATREGKKVGLQPEPLEKLLPSPDLEHLAYMTETSEMVRGNDRVWRQGGGAEDYDYDDIPFRERLLNQLPQALKETIEPSESYKALLERINRDTDAFHLHASARVEPKWEKWAELAGFDEWDYLALKYKSSGTSRERALATQTDERSRKALQAAWKKFDRSGITRLQKVLKKIE